ncbi:MAG: MarR family transcriptional regulator [Acidobacteriaceae bacterium]
MTRKQPDGPRTSVAFLLAQVGARAAQEFAQALTPLKLTPADAGILRLLSHSPGISQQDLARRLDMHASKLVAVIDALEESALVVREANPQDRRIYSLRLTDAGAEKLRAIGEVARAHDEAICFGLNPAERAALAGLLQRIAARHELTPGVHPGYKDLRVAPK